MMDNNKIVLTVCTLTTSSVAHATAARNYQQTDRLSPRERVIEFCKNTMNCPVFVVSRPWGNSKLYDVQISMEETDLALIKMHFSDSILIKQDDVCCYSLMHEWP